MRKFYLPATTLKVCIKLGVEVCIATRKSKQKRRFHSHGYANMKITDIIDSI